MASQRRTAKDVIDQAINENKVGERLLYVLSTMAAVCGLSVVLWAAFKEQPLIAIAGSICTVLIWPAIQLATRTRKENIALRMLEVPLSQAATENAAADMLQSAFLVIFRETDIISPNRKKTGIVKVVSKSAEESGETSIV